MGSAPAVSVLMAVHNGRAYLPEAIDSILQQTFRDFEFIIVDDGSSDDSLAILSAYAATDTRIRVISQPNRGLTKSLNTALGLAIGEFIARFDADDISLPDRLQRQVNALRSNNALVLLGSEVELITPDGLRLGPRGHARDHQEIRRRLLLGGGGALTHPAVMMRRLALEAIGGYDEAFPVAQDLDLFLRLSEVGEVGNLAETLLMWRQHDSSINRTRAHLWAPLIARAIENTINRIGAAEYASGLFYQTGTMPSLGDPLDLAERAELGGRYRTAARLYARALKTRHTRLPAIKRLLGLTARRVKRYIFRS
jgi:glycosyltransferase involved in cell wall biosynthesis